MMDFVGVRCSKVPLCKAYYGERHINLSSKDLFVRLSYGYYLSFGERRFLLEINLAPKGASH